MSRECLQKCSLPEHKQSVSIQSSKGFLEKINRNCLFFIAGIFLFIGTNGYSQSEITKLIDYTLVHSREVNKSNLQVEEAKYLRKEAIGQGLLQVEGSGSYSKMFLSIDISQSMYDMVDSKYAAILDAIGNMDALYMASIGVQVSQLLYSQKFWEGLKATKKTQELYSILKNKTEEEVIEEIANNYYQTLSLEFQLQTVNKSLVNLKEIYRIADLNYKNNLLKESTVNRLKVTMTNLDVTRQTIQNGINLQLNYIKVLAGMPNDTIISIDTATMNIPLIAGGTPVLFSIDNVPAYQTLLKQDEIYLQQVKLAQAEYYPNLVAFGKLSYSSYNSSSSIDKMYNMSTIGLQLKVPIFSSGVRNAKVQQTKIKEYQLKEDILKTKDLLSVSYNNAVSEYQSACSLLAVQKENRELAVKVYDQTSMQYTEGMVSMSDLLNVNSDLLQADNSYHQQMLKCKLSEIKLLKTTGNLKQLSSNK